MYASQFMTKIIPLPFDLLNMESGKEGKNTKI